jgi:glucose-6-phosphate 1-dehydrogenase
VAQTQVLQDVLRDEQRLPRVPEPGVMVIFGASGDLTARKLIPALYDLAAARKLPMEPHARRPRALYLGGRGRGRMGHLCTVMRAWSESKEVPSYPAGTWGLKESDELVAHDGREWRRP